MNSGSAWEERLSQRSGGARSIVQRRFYRDALGFRETASSEGWVHLEFPGGRLFELVQRPPSPQYEVKRYQVARVASTGHDAQTGPLGGDGDTAGVCPSG
jgi:hypothetical protein